MRIAAVACSVLVVALLAADPFLSRHEASRLAPLVDVRVKPCPSGETPAVLAEFLGGTGDAEEAARMARWEIIAAAVARREKERQFTAARERLKGGSAMRLSKILSRIGVALLISSRRVLAVRAVLNYTEGRALTRAFGRHSRRKGCR